MTTPDDEPAAVFEKVGPMQWRVSSPGREPTSHWCYAIVTPDGVWHTESFTATAEELVSWGLTP